MKSFSISCGCNQKAVKYSLIDKKPWEIARKAVILQSKTQLNGNEDNTFTFEE